MSDLWFLSSADPWEAGDWFSPDPVTLGSTGWTWDLEFVTGSNQWTYARTSLNSFTLADGSSAYVFSGIVAYRTRGDRGDTVHRVGESGPDGVVDFMNDKNVDSVTFGWGIGGDTYYCRAHINMEVWVSD